MLHRYLIYAALVLGALASIGAGWWLYDLGKLHGADELRTLRTRNGVLEKRLNKLLQDNKVLHEKSAILKRSSQIDRQAALGVKDDLATLEEELQAAREEVEFYRGIVSPGDVKPGLRIHLGACTFRFFAMSQHNAYSLLGPAIRPVILLFDRRRIAFTLGPDTQDHLLCLEAIRQMQGTGKILKIAELELQLPHHRPGHVSKAEFAGLPVQGTDNSHLGSTADRVVIVLQLRQYQVIPVFARSLPVIQLEAVDSQAGFDIPGRNNSPIELDLLAGSLQFLLKRG